MQLLPTGLGLSGYGWCVSSRQVVLGTWNLDKNLDKGTWTNFYHVFSSCKATCPSSPAELGQGTWTTAGCLVIIYLEPAWHRSLPAPARHRSRASPPSHTDHTDHTVGGGLALRVRNWSLRPGAPPARQPPPSRATCPASEHPLPRRVLDPVANAGLLHSILRPTQDCSTQSCGQRRIAPLNPVANAGLLHSILWPTQDCSTQSCAQFAPWPTP